MISIIDKWQIFYQFDDTTETTIFIHDNHIENIFKQISNISFSRVIKLVRIEKVHVVLPNMQGQTAYQGPPLVAR